MLKFRVTSPREAEDQEFGYFGSTTKLQPNKRKSEHFLVAEQTGRISFRRSSVPIESFDSFCENDLDCVRYSKSSHDLSFEPDPPLMSTFKDGETSKSFVRLISKGRSSYDVSKANEEDTNSYRGFSNFDDIALRNPDQVSLDNDSGLGSLNPRGARKNLQSLDLADLGILPHQPPWSPIVRQVVEVKAAKFKWTFGLQFVLAFLAFSMGSDEKAIVQSEAGGAFFFAHTTIQVAFGLPFLYLLCVIGQFWGEAMPWHYVPAARGLSWGIAASMAIKAVLQGVTVAHAIYYLILAFHRALPWTICQNESQCHLECDSTVMECESPGLEFWYQFTGNGSKTNVYLSDDLGVPKWDLLIALHVGWLLIFLGSLKGMEVLSKIIYVSALLPIVILFTMLAWKADGGVAILHVLAIDSAQLLSLDLWMRASSYSILMIGNGIGVITCLASYNKPHFKLNLLVPLIILANLLYTWFTLILARLAHLPKWSHKSYLDITFGLILESMSTHKFLAGIFITFILVTKLNSMAILIDGLVAMSGQSRIVLASLVFCVTGAILGIIFTIPNGLALMENTAKSVDISTVLFVPMLVLTILFGFGVNWLSDNVYVMMGSPLLGLSKVWMAAFLPASILPIMVSYFNQEHHNVHTIISPKEKVHIYSITILLIAMPVMYAVVVTLKAAYFGDSIKSLFTCDPLLMSRGSQSREHNSNRLKVLHNRLNHKQFNSDVVALAEF